MVRASALLFLTVLTMAGGSLAPAEDCNVTGVWNSSFGRLELKQDGSRVTGTYAKPEGFFEKVTGKVEGTVKGDTIDWKWTQSDQDQGMGQWTVSPSCRSLDGKWGRTKDLELGSWFATRGQ